MMRPTYLRLWAHKTEYAITYGVSCQMITRRRAAAFLRCARGLFTSMGGERRSYALPGGYVLHVRRKST